MTGRTSTTCAFALVACAFGVTLGPACGKQELVATTPYTEPPNQNQAVDVPQRPSSPDAGLLKTKQPGGSGGCQPESPPAFCNVPSDCKGANDICISHTCEPLCFAQCGDYPPGLPQCPNPLVCEYGVCTVPPKTTGGTGGTAPGTTSGARLTTSSTGTGSTGTGGTAGSTTAGATTSGGAASATATTGGIGATTGGVVPGTSTGGGVAATSTGGIVPACPDPSIAGDWTMNSTYEIAQGLSNGYPGLLGAINEVANFLNTWSYAFLVPSWVSLIFNDLTGFDVLFQNLNVVSDMELAPFSSNAWSYTSTETWEQVTVMFHGTPLAVPPQASYDSPDPYEVDTCTGTTTFQDHDISGAVTGLIPPLLDAIVQADCEFQGCPYSTFAQLMNGILEDVIPCSELDDGSLLGSLGATACAAAEQAVSNDIEAAIGLIPIDIGVASVQGTAPTNPAALDGTWAGSLSGAPFPGTLDATVN